jgi:hypothetical protein
MILIFILIIILFFLIYKYFYQKTEKFEGFGSESFQEGMKPRDAPTKKGLICYYGGAFRDGGNASSVQDTDRGYDAQYYATQTHLKLTEVIKAKGYNVDTIINTYHSTYEKDLTKWYDVYDIIFNTLNKNIKSTIGRDNLIRSSIKNIKNLTPDNYDFVLFIRIDLFLKPGFFDILDINSNKINFIANNYDTNTCLTHNKQKDPVVVDLILFVPKKFFYILDSNFKLNHDAWTYYKQMYKVSDNDLGFMTDQIFDSNSYRDLNNFYLMVSRKENLKIHNTIVPWDHNYEKNMLNKQNCNSYSEMNESYLNNPAEVYYNKHKSFYNIPEKNAKVQTNTPTNTVSITNQSNEPNSLNMFSLPNSLLGYLSK